MRNFIFIGMMLCVLTSFAQATQVRKDSVRVYFRQGTSVVDLHYLDNASCFSLLSDRYLLYSRYPQYWLKGIRIISSASPEGSFSLNERLSQQRAKTVSDFLKSKAWLDTSLLQVQPLGEDWKGLRYWVETTPDVPFRKELLESLSRYSEGQEGEWDLKQIAGGEAYRYLYHHVYPLLRQTNVVFDVVHEREYSFPERVSLKRPMPEMGCMLVPLMPVLEAAEEDTRTVLALKTNLLYDAVSWLNFSLEVPIGDKFSAIYYHQFPWWRWGEAKNEYCMRFLSIGAEGRWWFKPMPREASGKRIERDKLMGHFVGVYAESGKWDFERKRDICYQGEHWSVGLSYGYAMPIGKRLNLELSASVGYANIPHRGYEPAADYSELYHLPEKDGTWHYIGPTKLQVSLVLPFTVKVKKGGEK